MIRRTVVVAVVAALFATLSASAALAESTPAPIRGTSAGDALYGTQFKDTMYGLGGADLVYGYSGRDVIYGGSERGWGDKILGGSWGDKIRGQAGDDALYGQRGNDRVNGGRGADLLVGGAGRDTLNGGPGLDQINAQDGRRDIIIMCGNERDEVYYDRGVDVLRYCGEGQSTNAESMAATSSEAPEAPNNLSTQKPPEDLFESTGKVLVEHEGDRQCVAEKELANHLDHGDEILNPAGCSTSKGRG